MKNILFSTTRQWNPGDEFILYGIMNLLHKKYGEFNSIIYNRNPDINKDRYLWGNSTKKVLYNILGKLPKGTDFLRDLFGLIQYDNSIKFLGEIPNIDLCVFAGTPEWYQDRLKPLYDYINNNSIPCIYLGIGMSENATIDDILHKCGNALRQAKVITVRDERAKKILSNLNVEYITCPSILSSPTSRLVTEVKKIGLIYGTYKSVPSNRISKKAYSYILKLYRELQKEFDVEIVCHYIDDLAYAELDFPSCRVRYSYDSSQYFHIYNEYDLVIGPRVHGIGISASMGIPGMIIKHDLRGDTANGFCANSIDINNDNIQDVLVEIRDECNTISEHSKLLHRKKAEVEKRYLELLQEI